jgi:hypothetical protein
LTAVSASQRRASAHCRRPRTGKIATSAITRVYAEKAAQRTGSVRLYERSPGEPFAHSLNGDLHAARVFYCNALLVSPPRQKQHVQEFNSGRKAERGSGIKVMIELLVGPCVHRLLHSRRQFRTLNRFLIENVAFGGHVLG